MMFKRHTDAKPSQVGRPYAVYADCTEPHTPRDSHKLPKIANFIRVFIIIRSYHGISKISPLIVLLRHPALMASYTANSPSRLARLLFLIATLLVVPSTSLPVEASRNLDAAVGSIEARKTIIGGHGVVLGPGENDADFSASGGMIISPGQTQPAAIDVGSGTVNIGGVPVQVTAGDLEVNGKPVQGTGAGTTTSLGTGAESIISSDTDTGAVVTSDNGAGSIISS